MPEGLFLGNPFPSDELKMQFLISLVKMSWDSKVIVMRITM